MNKRFETFLQADADSIVIFKEMSCIFIFYMPSNDQLNHVSKKHYLFQAYKITKDR